MGQYFMYLRGKLILQFLEAAVELSFQASQACSLQVQQVVQNQQVRPESKLMLLLCFFKVSVQ